MNYSRIIGGSLIRSCECESLFNGVHYNFKTPAELKEKLSDKDWENGNWSNFRRFSIHAKVFALAVGLALRDSKIRFAPEPIVGLLVADDFEHEYDQEAYFADYIEGGRELGRSSLFVHTLPTSAAVDASICLGLRGPLLYIRDERDVWKELLNTASDLISSNNAEIMVLSYRSADTLVCLAISSGGKAQINWTAQSTPEAIFEFARKHSKGNPNENTADIK
ncbi:MAG: hypothetical protein WCR55_00375 [Lentisphaerota bacterium]